MAWNIKVMFEQFLDRNPYLKTISPKIEKQTINLNWREIFSDQIMLSKRTGKRIRRVLRFVRVFGGTMVLSYCVGTTVFNMIGYPAQVNGKSMQPALNFPIPTKKMNILGYDFNSDWVFVNCWRAKQFNLRCGDVVVLVSPKDPTDNVIKRIVAMEGDLVLPHNHADQYDMVHIPTGHCWVEGDNWTNSVDSNKYGPVALGLVFGVATHILWPPYRWQTLGPDLPPGCEERIVRSRSNSSKTSRR